MKKLLSFFLILGWMGLVILPSYKVYADTTEYSVKANIPGNQINKDLTYFDLKMNPGDKQELSLTLQNNSNEPIEIIIEPNTAITNQNGVIDYSQNEGEKDSSLIYAFSEIISEKQQITLKPNETKEVIFMLEMPAETLDGIILGGFHIYKVDSEGYEQTAQIENKYAYVIGVKLSETDTEVTPDLTLNEIQPTLINYRTAVTANLQNIEAINISNLEVTAQITKEGEKKVLYETTKTGLAMAPNSNFDFPISLDNQPLEAGKYHLYLTATDGEQTWEFDRGFEIEGEVASELNSEAVELEKDYTLLYIGISIIVTAILMLVIMLWVNKKRKNKK